MRSHIGVRSAQWVSLSWLPHIKSYAVGEAVLRVNHVSFMPLKQTRVIVATEFLHSNANRNIPTSIFNSYWNMHNVHWKWNIEIKMHTHKQPIYVNQIVCQTVSFFPFFQAALISVWVINEKQKKKGLSLSLHYSKKEECNMQYSIWQLLLSVIR